MSKGIPSTVQINSRQLRSQLTADVSFNGFLLPEMEFPNPSRLKNPDKIRSNVNPTTQGRSGRTLTVSCLCLTICQTIMAA